MSRALAFLVLLALCDGWSLTRAHLPPDPAQCDAESCMTMPTNCGARPECVGCGELCFPTHPPTDLHFSFLVNSTGLSEQSNSPFSGDFPPQTHEWQQAAECQPTQPLCIRGDAGGTPGVLHKYRPKEPESASNEACCKACVAMDGAKAWQMITKKNSSTPQCWCMSTTLTKVPAPDSCVSARTSPPGQHAGYLRSADMVISWDAIEETEGTLDWTALTTAVADARASGGVLTVLFWTGIWGPNWMYTANATSGRAAVPVIASKDGRPGCAQRQTCCPDYRDATYQSLLRSRHIKLANELRSLDALGNVVIGFQPCIGSTGDDTPIHLEDGWKILNSSAMERICGDPKCKGHHPDSWWHTFTRSFAHSLATDKALFGSETTAGDFALLLNAQGESFGGLAQAAEKFPGSFLKFGQAGHEYQSNFERYRAAQHTPYVYSLQTPLSSASSTAFTAGAALRPIRSRAELSAETCWTSQGKYFDPAKCPVKPNVLAMSRWVAAVHLDYWNIQPGSIASVDASFEPIWRFLNRYSGLRFPQQREARGCWIAFRDGLDATDLDRFPASTFGPLDGNASRISKHQQNIDRAEAICATHAAQGCTIDSNTTLVGGPMSQRRQDGMNDVAFGN
eukprot:COSAG01_NODE_2428_length_7717_cov_5.280126_1_plen_624_part_00